MFRLRSSGLYFWNKNTFWIIPKKKIVFRKNDPRFASYKQGCFSNIGSITSQQLRLLKRKYIDIP